MEAGSRLAKRVFALAGLACKERVRSVKKIKVRIDKLS
jgi:hypothetical protein